MLQLTPTTSESKHYQTISFSTRVSFLGRCDSPRLAPPPCGISDVCQGRPDGQYPALIRGCSYYYDCQQGQFTSLRRCTIEEGGYFFNPDTGKCDYPQNICPPCGYKWWDW
ncbi:hypothetical protein PoB_002909300 [Plakobranchus ocellatus]|uniref:Chitin-binding type-2 domain-containing protein n=1 Tax=Plakobranchus ocellatus TaxID=259542 RepID=A0AAV4A5W9_9GAST|nr:hypothetical protein PoB_002909300 [Plakobranchus ocellatus]